MTSLSNLKPRPGAKHRTKRLGCGESSGHGKTSGKGHKGQKARSGGSIRLGFEGGQMPLMRKMPKRGFNNTRFREGFLPVNIGRVSAHFEAGATITPKDLISAGLVPDRQGIVKLLSVGDVAKAFHFKGVAVSAVAKAKVEAAGGSVE
ncbi:MAG: 50S ribosomal protein L15 [Chthoniobacteraceae bacterium]|jgi:large subunit ribosomal protein L15|nr:50S ribosomal protein L15 [Chthoniobacteraceae bacterium]